MDSSNSNIDMDSLVKLTICDSKGNKRNMYRNVPTMYREFLMLCENFQIQDYSVQWIDDDGDYNEIEDQITYNSFLKYLPKYKTKKQLIFNERLIDNNDCELKSSTIKNLTKNVKLNSNETTENEDHIADTKSNVKIGHNYVSKNIQINNDLMQIISKIISNFNIVLQKIFYIFDDSLSYDLKGIVLELLNNFNQMLLKIIELPENNRNASKNESLECDSDGKVDTSENKISANVSSLNITQKNVKHSQATQTQKTCSETDYPNEREDFFYENNIDGQKRKAIDQMIGMGFENGFQLIATLKKTNYNVERAVEIYLENQLGNFSNEDPILFTKLNID